MRLYFILMFISILIDNSIIAQNFEWARKMGGSGNEDARAIALDKNENVYTTGHFEGIVDFDPGASVFNLTSQNSTADIFISKLDVSGNFVWAKSIGSAVTEASYSIAVDSFGNVYTVGFFNTTTDFDPGVGVFNLIPNYAQSVFILKLDSMGDFVWAKSVGTKTTAANQYSHPYMALDANANVYISNAFFDTIDFDPGIGVFNLTNGGVFVLKLDSSGDFVWAKKFGGGECYGLTVDVVGNVYSTGEFEWTADFDPGAGVFNLTAQGFGDFYISKLDSLGNFVWAKAVDGEFGTRSRGIIVDTYNNTYITGYFRDSADFNPDASAFKLYSDGGQDIFILKLDSAGSFVWAKNIGGSGYDQTRSNVTLDAMGNVYFTGSFFGVVDFDPNAGVYNLTTNGAFDIFILKLDPSSNFVWARGMGGTQYDDGYGIAIGSDNAVYTTGFFRTTTDFDPNAGVYNLTAAGTGGEPDIFIHKMSQSQNTPTTKIENPLSITLYPNPSSGIVQLEIGQDFRSATIEIINTLGQVLARTQTSDRNSWLVLPDEAGIYFVRVEVEGKVGVYRIVKN